MSGGHFDYKQFHIGEIVDEVDHLIEHNDDQEVNDYGYCKYRGFPLEVIERFKLARKTLRQAYVMAQRIDWLVSCDDGVEDFIEAWNKELEDLGDK